MNHVGEVWVAYADGDKSDPDPYIYAVVKREVSGWEGANVTYTLLVLQRSLFVPGSTCFVGPEFFHCDTTMRIA